MISSTINPDAYAEALATLWQASARDVPAAVALYDSIGRLVDRARNLAVDMRTDPTLEADAGRLLQVVEAHRRLAADAATAFDGDGQPYTLEGDELADELARVAVGPALLGNWSGVWIDTLVQSRALAVLAAELWNRVEAVYRDPEVARYGIGEVLALTPSVWGPVLALPDPLEVLGEVLAELERRTADWLAGLGVWLPIVIGGLGVLAVAVVASRLFGGRRRRY